VHARASPHLYASAGIQSISPFLASQQQGIRCIQITICGRAAAIAKRVWIGEDQVVAQDLK